MQNFKLIDSHTKQLLDGQDIDRVCDIFKDFNQSLDSIAPADVEWLTPISVSYEQGLNIPLMTLMDIDELEERAQYLLDFTMDAREAIKNGEIRVDQVARMQNLELQVAIGQKAFHMTLEALHRFFDAQNHGRGERDIRDLMTRLEEANGLLLTVVRGQRDHIGRRRDLY